MFNLQVKFRRINVVKTGYFNKNCQHIRCTNTHSAHQLSALMHHRRCTNARDIQRQKNPLEWVCR